MSERKRRRNGYRQTGNDYADPSYAYLITLRTRIKAVVTGSPVDPMRPFASCLPLAKQAVESLAYYRRQGK